MALVVSLNSQDTSSCQHLFLSPTRPPNLSKDIFLFCVAKSKLSLKWPPAEAMKQSYRQRGAGRVRQGRVELVLQCRQLESGQPVL